MRSSRGAELESSRERNSEWTGDRTAKLAGCRNRVLRALDKLVSPVPTPCRPPQSSLLQKVESGAA